MCPNETDCKTHLDALDMPLSRKNWIDIEVTDEHSYPKVGNSSLFLAKYKLTDEIEQVKNGVKFGEGDGTVSLLSLGAMCTEGWKRKRWNPAGIKVITNEVFLSSIIDFHFFFDFFLITL